MFSATVLNGCMTSPAVRGPSADCYRHEIPAVAEVVQTRHLLDFSSNNYVKKISIVCQLVLSIPHVTSITMREPQSCDIGQIRVL